MIQTLIRNWWLLALCGALDAVMSVIYFDHSRSGFASMAAVVSLGRVALAAGLCAVAAGLWSSGRRKSWLLVLNGAALAAMGLILNGLFGFRISLRTIALLFVVMALSLGILAFATAIRVRRHSADEWLLAAAGTAAVVFASGFLALGFQRIRLHPGSQSDLLWFGSFFGFSALCMLGLALRLTIVRHAVHRLAAA